MRLLLLVIEELGMSVASDTITESSVHLQAPVILTTAPNSQSKARMGLQRTRFSLPRFERQLHERKKWSGDFFNKHQTVTGSKGQIGLSPTTNTVTGKTNSSSGHYVILYMADITII